MNQEHNFLIKKPESGAKKFWRIVLGTMVGFFLSFFVVSIIGFFFMISALVAFTPSAPVVKENSILKIDLSSQIVERGVENPFEDLDLDMFGVNATQTGLNDILACIESAAIDPHITGIFLNVSHPMAAQATIKEIRDALEKFKASGKFIYSYSDNYSQNGYYLSSVADHIAMNAKGSLDFKGIASQILFYKGLINKLDLDMQIVRHGEFKSAVEPYILDKMSEANRKQMTVLTGSLWQVMLESIASSRGLSVETLNSIADELSCENAEQALKMGLVDTICYYRDAEQKLRDLAGIETAKALNFVSISSYRKAAKTPSLNTKDKIAVIYAFGNIVDGKGMDNSIGSESLSQTIKEAYSNDNVKAIVLRVNSPGGSALASEIIWNEIELAKKAGKIVVTSMGDYAASGGYYIACNSDAIVAQPNTLTGSIGVFGMIPNVQNFLKNKLGVTVDVVKTNPHADHLSGFRKMDEMEAKKIQASIEDIYATFTQRVADGRNMKIEKVDEIGQGRVWAGKDAIEIGLVDQLGNMNDAILLAAKLASITEYKLDYYPRQKDWFTKLFNKEDVVLKAMKEEMGELYFTYDALKEIMEAKGIQARMPMDLIIE